MGTSDKIEPPQKNHPLIRTLPIGITTLITLLLAFLGAYHSGEFETVATNQVQSLVSQEEEIFLAAEGAIFLVNPASSSLVALPLSGDREVRIIPLDEVPLKVVPTPGGVSVFVLFHNSSVIRVYSAQTFELQKTIETGKGPLDDLSFSPTGERVYLVSQDGEEITEYSHRLLELSNPVTHNHLKGSAAPVANRRGTRLYQSGIDSIKVLFGQTLALIEELDPGLGFVTFDPGFTHLWGFDQNQVLRVIDERTGSVVMTKTQDLLPSQAVVTNTMNYLSKSRDQVIQFVPRSSASPVIVPLPWMAEALVRGPGQGVWAIRKDGVVAEILNGVVQNQFTPTGLSGSPEFSAAITAIVRNDGSFACF